MNDATQQDMIDRFSEDEIRRLSDRAEPPAGEIDAAVVARALTDASLLIDGYLSGRYQLPIISPPALLGQLACDIARYHLHDDMPTDAVTQRHKDALAHLKLISDGKIKLQVAGIQTPESAADVRLEAPGQKFSRKTLGGF